MYSLHCNQMGKMSVWEWHPILQFLMWSGYTVNPCSCALKIEWQYKFLHFFPNTLLPLRQLLCDSHQHFTDSGPVAVSLAYIYWQQVPCYPATSCCFGFLLSTQCSWMHSRCTPVQWECMQPTTISQLQACMQLSASWKTWRSVQLYISLSCGNR